MEQHQKRIILVIGAGLGGLAAAYYFAHEGHNVKLFEKRPSFPPRGGTMSIRPNATRSLIRWGLRISFDAVADDVKSWSFRSLETGKELARHMNEGFSGFPGWGIDRKTTQRIFFEHAEKEGAKMEFGQEVVGIGENGSTSWVEIRGRRRIEGDLVLVADGITSRFRADVIGEMVEPIVMDAVNFPIELDGNAADHSGLREDLANSSEGVVWIGERKYGIGRYATKLNVAWLIFDVRGEPPLPGDMVLWEKSGNLEYVREVFKGCHKGLESALTLAKNCDKWRLAHLPVLPRWRSEKGRLLLLGDSAHAMLPNVAQGFSSIVEDIDALGTCLTEYPPDDIAGSTEAWQQIRIPRLAKIQAYARAAFDGFSGGAKDKANKNGLPDYESPDFVRWVVDYDAREEARKYCKDRASV